MKMRTGRGLGPCGALVTTLLALGGCDRPDAGDGDPAAAEQVVADLFASMNARDAERVLAHYVPGDDLVHVACTTIRRGHEPVARVLRTWLEDHPELAIEHRVVRSQALGRAAAVIAADGVREDGTRLYWTFVLRRDADGSWRVLQEHQSWAGCREQRVHPMS
jgi:ketosteroid isomerase-like protein